MSYQTSAVPAFAATPQRSVGLGDGETAIDWTGILLIVLGGLAVIGFVGLFTKDSKVDKKKARRRRRKKKTSAPVTSAGSVLPYL